MKPIDNYFLQKPESLRESMLFLRSYLSSFDSAITEEWKYSLPFYYYKNKMFCYLNIDKKSGHPYIGIVDGSKMDFPELVKGDRKRMKVLIVDPGTEIPVAIISKILSCSISIRNRK